jgi:hypothetical protein
MIPRQKTLSQHFKHELHNYKTTPWHTLKAQAHAEDEALQDSEWFISDRSGIDPIVYARKPV